MDRLVGARSGRSRRARRGDGPFKTPIEGLYLAGASTFPGAGTEAVVISGVIAADDI